MKITKSKLREMIRHSLDELAIQKALKLSNDLEVDVMDDGSAVMRTKQGVVNLSPKNYKILSRRIKQGKMESVNEARLKDVVPDIIFIAGQYTRRNLDHIARQSWSSSADLIKQISDDYLGHSSKKHFERDVNKLLKQHSIREETLNEANYKLYHKTFTEAVEEVLKIVNKKGFEVDEDDWFKQVTTGRGYRRGRPSVGKTHRFDVVLTKKGKPTRKKVLFQVYGMESGKYELNAYIS